MAAAWLVVLSGWVRQADHDTVVWLYTLGARDHTHVAARFRKATDGILYAANFLLAVSFVGCQSWASVAGLPASSQLWSLSSSTSRY